MSIRLYRSEDQPACLAVFDSNCPPYFLPQEREQFLKWLNQPDRDPYYVLEVGTQIVACGGIYYDPSDDTVGLAWGMVLAACHRQAYGRQLTTYRLDQIERKYPGKEQRVETSQFTVAFYERMRFVVFRQEKNGFGEGLDKYDLSRRG